MLRCPFLLKDSAAQLVEAIWPLSRVAEHNECPKGVLPLRRFIEETLRRSRTSYSTLQVALYYLILIRPHVPNHDFTMEQTDATNALRALMCGRRMFLAALILASKYLQDKNYSARAWSKLSGLPIPEINSNEMIFVVAVKWKLHITEKVFQRWSDIVLKYTPSQPPSPTGSAVSVETNSWRCIIDKLTPELDAPELFMFGSSVQVNKPASPEFGYSHLTSTANSPEAAIVTGHAQNITTLRSPNSLLYTPPPSAICTPALSVASLGGASSRRSSMCTAMAQAQTSCIARTTLDKFAFAPKCGIFSSTVTSPPSTASSQCATSGVRRSSLATTCSLTSSPESMISDHSSVSSRSSRSSSISSVSSLLCAAPNASLAMQATCRNAKMFQKGIRSLDCVSEDAKPDIMDLTSSPDSYTNDFHNFSLGNSCHTPTPSNPTSIARDMSTVVRRAARSREYTPVSPSSPVSPHQLSRKRSRTDSAEDLQCQVRNLMAPSLLSLSAASVGKPAAYGPRVVLQRELSRKRAYCGEEILAPFATATAATGPGMWEGCL
jgi:hypothetical protein